VDAKSLPKIHHERQGVNYHMEPLRDRLLPLAERGEIPAFGGPGCAGCSPRTACWST
jgi:hypothetical protein